MHFALKTGLVLQLHLQFYVMIDNQFLIVLLLKHNLEKMEKQT